MKNCPVPGHDRVPNPWVFDLFPNFFIRFILCQLPGLRPPSSHVRSLCFLPSYGNRVSSTTHSDLPPLRDLRRPYRFVQPFEPNGINLSCIGFSELCYHVIIIIEKIFTYKCKTVRVPHSYPRLGHQFFIIQFLLQTVTLFL